MFLNKHRIDYGQDAPRLLQRYLFVGGLLAAAGRALTCWSSPSKRGAPRLLFTLGWVLQVGGMASLLRGLLMVWSSRVGKVKAATHLIETLDLQGDETILDLGCGRGLLLLEAALRLPHGKAIGLDIWSQEDQGNNSRQATLHNAERQGVAARVEVRDGDMRDLSFLPDESIDAVIASKAVHNLPDRAGRALALKEATRVLKPGGRMALMDIFLLEEFAESLRACGMQEVRVSTLKTLAYPPLRTVTAVKRASEQQV